jgi:hypothetical protein
MGEDLNTLLNPIEQALLCFEMGVSVNLMPFPFALAMGLGSVYINSLIKLRWNFSLGTFFTARFTKHQPFRTVLSHV